MSLKQQIENVLRPVARRLPSPWRAQLRHWWYGATTVAEIAPLAEVPPADLGQSQYEQRLHQEASRFAQEEEVHDLPAIFHYWSNTYLRSHLEAFGFSYPEDFFARQIERHIAATGKPARIVSIGAGNCDAEATVARLLLERGVSAFRIDCLDITDAMLQRGRALVVSQGISDRFGFALGDFNHWQPDGHYDVVMANQSLHHVTNLEGLFDAIDTAIGDDGIFITSDMIGRNGHQRWPEALSIVQDYWQELPDTYRYNRQLRRQEQVFMDWDCAVEGFEGVRAQDILPLAVSRFGFDFFFAYGNVVDPFIDRSFGPNFNADAQWDREFIDRLHARDEAEILAGTIKPTHMLAAMRRRRDVTPVVFRHLTPRFCCRTVD